VRSRTSLNFQYPLFSLRSYSSCLRFLPRLPVTSILPSNFPSLTCFIKISSYARCDQSSYPSFFLLFVGYFSSPRRLVILLHFSHDPSNLSPTAPCFKTFQVGAFLIYFSKCPSFNTIHSYAPNMALYYFLP